MSSDSITKFITATFHFEPKNPTLFEQALTHRSFLNETKSRNSHSYERLEFLGDSILSFCISQLIYTHYPDLTEGEMTNLRSSVVKTDTLAIIANQIKLGAYLLLSKGEEESGGRQSTSLLADCMEATISAIFLDQGLTATEKVIDTLFIPLIEEGYSKKQLKDYKSLLQEVAQDRFQVSPLYKVVKTEGPDHRKVFTINAIINNNTLSTGRGLSKQKAEQEAAKIALEKWGKS